MKKILFSVIIAFASLSAKSQGADQINYRTVHLMSKISSVVNVIWGSKKSLITTPLGQPSTINHLDWATLTSSVDEYIYNGSNSIYIDVSNSNNNFLWGFVLHTNDFYIYYNTKIIKIGDNIDNVIKRTFPVSYSFKSNNTLSISLTTDNGSISDSYLYFNYDNNNLITEIGMNTH